MIKQDQEPIELMLNGLFDSAGLNDSFMGQIAKGIITKAVAKYTQSNIVGNLELNNQWSSDFSRLSEKWRKCILDDLSKLYITDNEKKLLVAMFLASMASQVLSFETTDMQTDLTNK